MAEHLFGVCLSSPFVLWSIIDHTVLSNCQKVNIGISGHALKWFIHYLTDRQFSVSIGDSLSSLATCHYGIPKAQFYAPSCSPPTYSPWVISYRNTTFNSIPMLMTHNYIFPSNQMTKSPSKLPPTSQMLSRHQKLKKHQIHPPRAPPHQDSVR